MIIYCCVHLFKKNTAGSEVISARLSILLDLLSVQHEFQVFFSVCLFNFARKFDVICFLHLYLLNYINFLLCFLLMLLYFFERRFNQVRRKENDKEIVPFLKKTLLWKYDDKSFWKLFIFWQRTKMYSERILCRHWGNVWCFL